MWHIEQNDYIENRTEWNNSAQNENNIDEQLEILSKQSKNFLKKYEDILNQRISQENEWQNTLITETIEDIKKVNESLMKIHINNLDPEKLKEIDWFSEITKEYLEKLAEEINQNNGDEEIITIIEETEINEETTVETNTEANDIPGKTAWKKRRNWWVYTPKVTTTISEEKNDEQRNRWTDQTQGNIDNPRYKTTWWWVFGRWEGNSANNNRNNNGIFNWQAAWQAPSNAELNGVRTEEFNWWNTNITIKKPIKIWQEPTSETIWNWSINSISCNFWEENSKSRLEWNWKDDFSIRLWWIANTEYSRKNEKEERKNELNESATIEWNAFKVWYKENLIDQGTENPTGEENSSWTPSTYNHSREVNASGNVDSYWWNIIVKTGDSYDAASNKTTTSTNIESNFKANWTNYNAWYNKKEENGINTTWFNIWVTDEELWNWKIEYSNSENWEYKLNINGEVANIWWITYNAATKWNQSNENIGISKIPIWNTELWWSIWVKKDWTNETITWGANVTINADWTKIWIWYEKTGNEYMTINTKLSTEKWEIWIIWWINEEQWKNINISWQLTNVLWQNIVISWWYSEKTGYKLCTWWTIIPIENLNLNYNIEYIRLNQENQSYLTPNRNNFTALIWWNYQIDRKSSINFAWQVTINENPTNVNLIMTYEKDINIWKLNIWVELKNIWQASQQYMATMLIKI